MNNRKNGIGFVGTLTLIFIVLKILNLITWSWIWVLAPIWISALIAIIPFAFILVRSRIKNGRW
ncbi:hypothetical protein [Anaerosacchariphilus polymeriproducens]|uniref:Transmembrane Fragile-X-F protein n=1 Tax=Anaerosacchariphilus polymeriproducens TaxID=1812858 RepID=A0A371AXD9_9FIRM|nr:hypothetical protein [Anaerosacchariphilus polymeriproducens]RDU24201.1 hypothetical protein DWV06_05750 [Anaerosacchariphilus polymeriproducens]